MQEGAYADPYTACVALLSSDRLKGKPTSTIGVQMHSTENEWTAPFILAVET